jgi:hypothetical protein
MPHSLHLAGGVSPELTHTQPSCVEPLKYDHPDVALEEESS